MKPKRLYTPNPTRPGALKPVSIITDRAKRYRANNAIEQTDKVCIYCGKPETAARPLMVDHIDGHEDHGDPQNLAYACRSCNTRKGIVYRKNGLGRLTRQYNPKRGRRKPGKGIRSLAQFIQAIQAVKGEGAQQMDLFDANQLLRDTSPADRSMWAREANKRRWAAAKEVPF